MKKIFIAALLLSACSKQRDQSAPVRHCETIFMLSDKYTLDTVLIRVDTLRWSPGQYSRRLCDSALTEFKLAAQDSNIFLLCGIDMLERRRYLYIK